MPEYILELKGIDKTFGMAQVLNSVDFQLMAGEIHALVGENGAGKSTLMNIVYGLVKPERGEIYVEGKPVDMKNAHIAQQNGIGFVHQEIALCPDVTVAENIFMANINNMRSLKLNYSKIEKQAKEILYPLVGDAIKPASMVTSLSISHQQVVEIAKAISSKCKVLIFDEPTAALSESETEALYKIMQDLKKEGLGIIYISHRMSEIFEQCDRVTVLRDGYCISTKNVRDVTPRSLVADMVGRSIENIYPKKADENASCDNVLVRAEGITDAKGRFKNISFELRKGELLGISGLVGAGRSEVVQAMTGLRKLSSGKVFLRTEDITGLSARKIFDKGFVYLSEDRKNSGLFLDMPIKHNISAMHLKKITRGVLLNHKEESEQGNRLSLELNVKCRNIEQTLRNLSGGNQQKVLVAKLLTVTPDVVIMDEPTRGIDVGAKAEIHKLLRKLIEQGIGVIMISSELNEVIGMCDRVLIMNEGALCGEVSGEEIDPKIIMNYASGANTISHLNC